MTTSALFLEFEQFVEKAMRGYARTNRATIGEAFLDVVPMPAREIVFGLAFAGWNGAPLRYLVRNLGPSWQEKFLAVAKKRIERLDANRMNSLNAEYEREALAGLLNELANEHPRFSRKVDEILGNLKLDEMMLKS